MQTPKVRLGILGTARIATVLVPAMQASSNCEVAAVASRDPEAAARWATDYGIPRSFGSYDEMLASDAIDAVYIPLPNALHKEWTIRAAQYGKHVLCEKPLAANAAEAQEMVDAAEASRVKLLEAFMYRYHPQFNRVQQMLAEGVVGTPKIVRASFGFFLSRSKDVRWSKELAGGALMDVGCYCVNAARLLLNQEPVAVTASAVWTSDGVDESAVGTLEFPGGTLAAIDCSMQTGPSMHQRVEISGTQGRITLPESFRLGEEPTEIHVERAERREIVTIPGVNEYTLMIEHFGDVVLNDREPAYPPQDAVANMRTLEGLLESARTGRKVAIST